MKASGVSIRLNGRAVIRGCAAAIVAVGLYASRAHAGMNESAASASLYETTGDSAPAASTSITPSYPSAAPSAPVKTETVVVPDSEPEPEYVKHGVEMPQTTTEIPQAGPSPEGGATGNEIVNYATSQNPNVDPQLHSLQEFINEGDNTSPLGIEVREARRKLKSGRAVDGLLIVGVTRESPAANAGLRGDHQEVRDALEMVAVVGALFFPPAVIAVPVLNQMHVGERYDLIVAVDGSRVTNFLDFEDRMRDVQPGEIVYLSVIRNGKRVQVAVHVPTTVPPPVF